MPPSISFNPATLDFGTVDAGSSSYKATWAVMNAASAAASAALNMSISIKGSENYSESIQESWYYVSTPVEGGRVSSVDLSEAGAGSVAANASIWCAGYVIVPSDASAYGYIGYTYYHRYQYTG